MLRLPRLVQGYCRLLTLSNETDAKLKERGLINEHGQWSAGVRLFALLKDKERKHLQTMVELAMQMRQGQPQPMDVAGIMASLPRLGPFLAILVRPHRA